MNTFIQQGWLCPRCGKINAPFVSYCSCNELPTIVNVPTCQRPNDSTGRPTQVITTTSEPDYSYIRKPYPKTIHNLESDKE